MPATRAGQREVALVAGGRVHDPPERGRALTIGTAPDVEVRLEGRHVSGRHARMSRHNAESGQVWLQDRDSTNGLHWNGARIDAAVLAPGDAVMLGRTPLLIAERLRAARYQNAVRWRGIVARDALSLAVLEDAARFAAAPAPVWIHGASGTGKEALARVLHDVGGRREGPFETLNCATLQDTLVESLLFGSEKGAFTGATKRCGAFARADRGTLFLDEVGDLSLAAQAKLLRVLETGEIQPVGGARLRRVDVRVISASWRDLRAEVDAGRFRLDLLQRLSVLRLEVPPLSARTLDIAPLVDTFGTAFGATMPLPQDTLSRLIAHRWPGNVRELRNWVRRAAVRGFWPAISEQRPQASADMPVLGPVVDEADRFRRARAVLNLTGGNRTEAARKLGVSRSTLYRWLAGTG